MNGERYSTLPAAVISAFLGLLAVGVVLGALFGAGVLSGETLTAIVLGGVTIFVPWAVLKLDPRSLTEIGEGRDQ